MENIINPKNQEIKLMKPKRDIIFKAIFADPSNVSLLESLLRSILKSPADDFKELQLVNTELIAQKKDDKLGRLDVQLQMKSGKIINVEIQVAKDMDMRGRVTFYGTRLLAGQLKSGQEYDELKPVICIVIADYLLIPENNYYHNQYTLYDASTESTFTNLLKINTLELEKLPQDSDGDLLWDWLKFLKAETQEDFEMIEQTNPEIKKAVAIVKELSQDERIRAEYEAREKALRDHNSRIKYMKNATQRGIEQGRQKEREKAAEERLIRARLAIESGVDTNLVMQLTGLSKDIISKLMLEIK